MRSFRTLAWLAAVAGCHSASLAQPRGSADPALLGVLAQVNEFLAANPGDGAALYQRASLLFATGAPHRDVLAGLERLDATAWDQPLAAVDFPALVDDPRYQAIAARIAARASRVERSTVAFTVPGPDLIPEGIAVDPTTGTFYLGSLRKRTILQIDPAGPSRMFVPEGHGGILGVTGIKVDPAHGLLWAASHASHVTPGHHGSPRPPDGVYAFALGDGSVRRRVVFRDSGRHLANDLALAADGAVYLTDSASGGVYRLRPDRDELEIAVPAGTLAYPNGIAFTGDGQLYVADALGIVAVSIDTGSVKRVTAAPGIALGGIDGMVADGQVLFAVQNAIGQPRIVELTLAGERVTEFAVLENAASALEQPTTTCLWQGALYTIANAQLDAFRADDQHPGRTLADPRILRTPLSRTSGIPRGVAPAEALPRD